MKKAHLWSLIAVTLVFTAFTAGFFLGRNQTGDAVVVSVPAVMQTQPPQTTEETFPLSPSPIFPPLPPTP